MRSAGENGGDAGRRPSRELERLRDELAGIQHLLRQASARGLALAEIARERSLTLEEHRLERDLTRSTERLRGRLEAIRRDLEERARPK